MRSVHVVMLLVIFGASFMLQVSLGAVYKVGDSEGWTYLGDPFYKIWAETKNFIVGDTILFEYDPQLHNVLHVTYDDYKSCKTTSPIGKYTSGNDSFSVTSHIGHHFFICGVPGACQFGMKVDINMHFPAPAPSNAPSV